MALKIGRWLMAGMFYFIFSFQMLAQNRQENTEEEEAEYEQYIQEFFFTEAVYPQEKNELQFTVSNYYREYHDLQLLVEYGFTDRFQIELELSDLALRGVTESIAGEIGLLYNAINRKGFSLSIATEVGIEEEFDESLMKEYELEWGPKVVFSNPLGPLQLHTDIGVEMSEDTEWHYNAGLIAPLNDWKGILELNGTTNESTDWQVTPGIIWNGLGKSEFAFGVPVSLSEKNNRTGFVVRMTIEFGGDED
ncbi:hypothetical protein FNH22_04360 [Fulvivirga sp. M361]|uniref:hypothetical protein n=1 Tax=Fulvivirga sp. M361 TaxID=2594266 RepID=UPI001179BB8B|nr:hypothetical protein [Fulvivirga sp. M361]TRX61295.1 hypothetical protein FNH22_04360 [Fulvivirga sp. M361]